MVLFDNGLDWGRTQDEEALNEAAEVAEEGSRIGASSH